MKRCANCQSIKIQIISRYVPLTGRAGHFTYLLEMMRYVHQCGCQIELDVLDPWYRTENIPDYINQIARVVIMPASFVAMRPACERRTMMTRLRPLWRQLPVRWVALLRTAWYRLRRRDLPGHHLPDALASDAEIAFAQARVKANRPAVLMTNETFLGNILRGCQDDARLLKTNIAFDLHHQRQAKLHESGVAAHFSEWDRQKEIDALKAADIIVAIHEDDAQTLRDMLPQAEVMCVPFPAHVQPHDAATQITGRCIFVGSSIATNTRGMAWFLREVWPLILQEQPQATLHVCGTVCESLQAFAAPNVRLLGRVDDLNAAYGAAEVCVIPLLAGSGLKIKLIEALSHGRACVATSVGVQGVQELTDRAVFVADAPAEFAQAVMTLLRQPEQRKAMEAQARKYVEEHLTPEKAYQPLIHRITQYSKTS